MWKGLVLAALGAGLASACVSPAAALTQLLEARRLASELRVQFTTASAASNRAVMADTDDASAGAAAEARRARQVVESDVHALRPILESLGYSDQVQQLEAFQSRFQEYRRLDDEILGLAVENTNIKAQRLSFGPARDAANDFRTSLDAAVRTSSGRNAEGIAARARIAVLEIQVLQPPHIAEAEDAAMTRMEQQMKASAAVAGQSLDELKAQLPSSSAAQLAAAHTAFDRFMSINAEIVRLSRRNSEVRSLALSFGRKRVVAAECEEHLRALEEALEKHQFTGTR
jgi:hypothetical protein